MITRFSGYMRRSRIARILLLVLIAQLAIVAVAAAATLSWRYTALGDSLAVGLIAWFGYVPRYQSYLRGDNNASVSLTNLGQSGWTSSDLLAALRTNATFRSAVSNAQVVTWDIGGNDFRAARSRYKAGTCGGADNQDCLRSTLDTFDANWDAIEAEVLALRSPSNTILRTMDLYNPYVSVDKASDTWPGDVGSDFRVFKAYLDAANNHIAATASSQGIPVAKVSVAFNGPTGEEDPRAKGYIAFDGLHPNDTGHWVIASLLRNLGYAPLK
jgi:lysophospholipase L1-like esterase